VGGKKEKSVATTFFKAVKERKQWYPHVKQKRKVATKIGALTTVRRAEVQGEVRKDSTGEDRENRAENCRPTFWGNLEGKKQCHQNRRSLVSRVGRTEARVANI